MERSRPLVVVLLVLLVAGCAVRAAAPSRPARQKESKEPSLPPGVIARARGRHGIIQGEERDGLRLLTIDGAVQAARPIARSAVVAVDPVVPLLRAMRPGARRALVIGLGSGKTAGDLARAGMRVEAVELEPAVIEMAREHFGYRGAAVAGDGLAHVVASRRRWDVILIDALIRDQPPAHFMDAAGLAALRDHLTDRGVLAVRMLGEPRDAIPLRKRVAEIFNSHHAQLYGGGVGDERQNLLLFGSKAALNVVRVTGLTMWPIPYALSPWGSPSQASSRGGAPGGAARAVVLVGYLIRMPDGRLALDLPHWEMGAVRYLLAGKALETLTPAVAAEQAFPTSGDIGSDGDTSRTLHDLLGGGGVKRSDVRFSPVVAVLEGTARLVSVVHPDAASRVPDEVRAGAVTDERLPYGGALYQLEVTTIHRLLAPGDWTAMKAPIVAAARHVDRDELEGAADAVDQHVALIATHFGSHADLLAAVQRARALAAAIKAAATGLAAGPRRQLARARACDRARQPPEWFPGFDEQGNVVPVLDALRRCAERHYERALRSSRGEAARATAARLLHIYGERWDDPEASRKEAALQKRFPGLETDGDPPP